MDYGVSNRKHRVDSLPVGFHIRLNKPPTHALRPVNPINARTLCITAAAGTELAGAYSASNVHYP